MYFFTGDEHFGHFTNPKRNIIKYCNRPFDTIEEMDKTIISNFNKVVTNKDHTIHVGDLTFKNPEQYIRQLNGTHTFLRGNHDRWMGKQYHEMWCKTIEGQHVVACHYAMRVWNRSHYGSWQVYGHSHGKLEPIGLQWDVGVDNNNFYPVSFEQLKNIMEEREKNG